MLKRFFLLLCCMQLILPTVFAQDQKKSNVPKIEREFRAAWVATVANINWPSKPGIPVKEQKKEALDILDSLHLLHFNAVILQVRPQADALYDSKLEPWSYFLTGKQGKAPSPFYDPLKFWIKEAHHRGMELHAWLNPYRAHHISAPPPGEESIIRQFPEAAVKLKEGYWWLDPANKKVQQHTLDVIKDMLLRYDLDGIHFDDYFYPYASYNKGEDFPDKKSWTAYQKEGGLLSKADWRRNAVNTLVHDIYYLIKTYKPFVKFGISPFGIWKPGHPHSIKGMNQYEQLYADAKRWLNYGWVDYLSPQLYWPINQIPQSFPVLLQWWQSQNTHDRYIWPGINDYRMGDDKSGGDELESQILINRAIANNGPGVIHWSVDGFLNKDALKSRLSQTVYARPALIPPLFWDAKKQEIPTPRLSIGISSDNQHVNLTWESTASSVSNFALVKMQYGGCWQFKVTGR